MSQGIGGVGGSGSVSGVGSLGTCTSVNFIFAKLQMELAASAKDSALGYIKQIESAQAEQKEVADLLQQARQAQKAFPAAAKHFPAAYLQKSDRLSRCILRPPRGTAALPVPENPHDPCPPGYT